jgi:hypothetical protein
MRILGILMFIAALAVAGFAVVLGLFLESGHSGSHLRNAGSRIMMEFRDDPRMHEITKHVFGEVALTFSWLDAAFLVVLACSMALLVSSILIFRCAKSTAVSRQST